MTGSRHTSHLAVARTAFESYPALRPSRIVHSVRVAARPDSPQESKWRPTQVLVTPPSVPVAPRAASESRPADSQVNLSVVGTLIQDQRLRLPQTCSAQLPAEQRCHSVHS